MINAAIELLALLLLALLASFPRDGKELIVFSSAPSA
jgi:hypothetical protein